MKKSVEKSTAASRVAETLKKWMIEKGVSDTAIAKKTGLPRTTIRNYLNGELKSLSLDKLEDMTQILGYSLPALLNQCDHLRGFLQVSRPEEGSEIYFYAGEDVKIEMALPSNLYLMYGKIHFLPNTRIGNKRTAPVDIWLTLKSLGGILTLEYGETKNLEAGEKILLNARYPFTLSYIADERNRHKLAEKNESEREITCEFISCPPFWLY